MASPFDELVASTDRVALSVFGEDTPIVYEPLGGPPVQVDGIFDRAFVLAKGDAEAGVESVGPAVFLRLEELPADPEEDDPTLTIRGVDYRVIERMPDGAGGIVLALRKRT